MDSNIHLADFAPVGGIRTLFLTKDPFEHTNNGFILANDIFILKFLHVRACGPRSVHNYGHNYCPSVWLIQGPHARKLRIFKILLNWTLR